MVLHTDESVSSITPPTSVSLASGQIDVLQAEVTALKTLVLTSTPSSPNRQLHPQLQSPGTRGALRGHTRNKSTSSALTLPHSQTEPGPTDTQAANKEDKEVGDHGHTHTQACTHSEGQHT